MLMRGSPVFMNWKADRRPMPCLVGNSPFLWRFHMSKQTILSAVAGLVIGAATILLATNGKNDVQAQAQGGGVEQKFFVISCDGNLFDFTGGGKSNTTAVNKQMDTITKEGWEFAGYSHWENTASQALMLFKRAKK
jgi:hypothetical protein